MKKQILRSLLAFMLILTVLTAYFPVKIAFGEDNDTIKTITLDEAIELALKNSHSLSKMDIQKNDLNLQIKKLNDAKNSIQNYILFCETVPNSIAQSQAKIDEYNKELQDPNIDDLTKADIGSKLQQEMQKMQIMIYQLIMIQNTLSSMGITSSDLSREQEFISIIKKFDFPIYELEAGIDNITAGKEASQNGIKEGVLSIYNAILKLNDNLSSLIELYENQKMQYDAADLKYKMGYASELERYTAQNTLEQTRLNINVVSRKLDNLNMQLKKMIGLDIKKTIKLEKYSIPSVEILNYESYLNKALSERSEIINALNNSNAKQKEFDVTKDYMDESSIDYKEAEQALKESNINLIEAKNNVIKDIKTGYADVYKKQKAMYAEEKKLKSAEESLNTAKSYYEQGYITKIDFNTAKIVYDQAVSGYESSKRDFYEAVLRLGYASGAGPKYVSDNGNMNGGN